MVHECIIDQTPCSLVFNDAPERLAHFEFRAAHVMAQCLATQLIAQVRVMESMNDIHQWRMVFRAHP